jgi:acyl carrier protein
MTLQVDARIHRVVSAVLGVPLELVDDATGQDSVDGWDSLSHIHLVVALEGEFCTTFTPEQALQMTSVHAIRDVLRATGFVDG